MQFIATDWDSKPAEARPVKGGKIIVTRNVVEAKRDGVTYYTGESAIMTETAYAAYLGAKEVAAKREQEIVDETILNLIEEGSL